VKTDRWHIPWPRKHQELGKCGNPVQLYKRCLLSGKPSASISEKDIGGPPERECHVDRMKGELLSTGKDAGRWIEYEVHHDCSFTIMKALQMVRNKLYDSDRSQIHVTRPWLEVGLSHLNFLECNVTAAINSAGPAASRRIEKWYPGSHWQKTVLPIQRFVGNVAEGDSVLVESVRLVLQRWRGVCSFSQTMRSTQSDEESHWCMTLAQKTKLASRMICSDRTQRFRT